VGGILVINAMNQRPGTLGLVTHRGANDHFLLSAYHVLCRPEGSAFVDGEVIHQPVGFENAVARVLSADTRPDLDIAAARVDPSVAVAGRILGLPPVTAPARPQVGMRVIKSGAATGITEGRVARVNGSRAAIEDPPGVSSFYEVSGFGDSGAVWVEASSGTPVALHLSVDSQGRAIALDIVTALTALNLQILMDGQ
jgi:hypothetical protein